jgi:hypothetical protein
MTVEETRENAPVGDTSLVFGAGIACSKVRAGPGVTLRVGLPGPRGRDLEPWEGWAHS